MVGNVKASSKSKAKAWISIVRIGNCIALGYAAIVGYLLSFPGNLDPLVILKLFVTAFLIGGGSNTINDYFDASIDAINKPWRPIPSGLINAKTALRASIVMTAIGVMISFTLSLENGFIALVAAILAFMYSFRLKKTFLVGNIVVASLVALSIIYGGLAGHNLRIDVFLASIFAFLLNLGREFIKGIEDVEGDKKYGIKTIATVKGIKAAYICSVIIFSILILLSVAPYILLGYSLLYTMMAILGVDIVILAAIIKASTLNPGRCIKCL
uniref:MFS transporter n=1 Tax=Ignisphaera aggregans TaxID=334771 RepID=A0A7C2ZLI0_9CREN